MTPRDKQTAENPILYGSCSLAALKIWLSSHIKPLSCTSTKSAIVLAACTLARSWCTLYIQDFCYFSADHPSWDAAFTLHPFHSHVLQGVRDLTRFSARSSSRCLSIIEFSCGAALTSRSDILVAFFSHAPIDYAIRWKSQFIVYTHSLHKDIKRRALRNPESNAKTSNPGTQNVAHAMDHLDLRYTRCAVTVPI